MKLENKILADALVTDIRGYIAREIAALKAGSASAERVELSARVLALEVRIARSKACAHRKR